MSGVRAAPVPARLLVAPSLSVCMSSFADSFRGTLEYAHKQLDDNYVSPNPKRGVVFPAPPTQTAPVPDLTADPSGTCTVTLKSIKAPKFSVEYTVPRSDSVYSVKERLLTDPSGPLQNEKHTPGAIKLLLKSKVIADTRQLAELPSTAFTVMISKDEEKVEVPLPAQLYWGEEADIVHLASATHTETAAPSAAAPAEKLPGLTDKFWNEIENVAKRYVENPHDLVTTFKNAVSAPRPSDELDLD